MKAGFLCLLLFFEMQSMVLELNDAKDWGYFNKGKANVLYKYIGNDQKLKRKLLRLRLSDQVITTSEVFRYINNKIKPLLPETIDCGLVKVEFNVDGALNDGFGLLVPNMLPEDAEVEQAENYFKTYKSSDTFILELKPKWLTNVDKKCRNCAHHKYKFGVDSKFCSLDLLERTQLSMAVSLITNDYKIQAALHRYFTSDENILLKLKNLQTIDQNVIDLESESDVTDQFCTVMTLRDVTVFLVVKDGVVINSVVTDTDPKSKSKWKHWVSTEKKLIDDGYYTRTNTRHN